MKLTTVKKIDNHKDDGDKISESLQNLLDANNLNANQLAQSLGIPMMTIRRLLSGETTDPRISTLKIVANHFKVSVDSLITGNVKSVSKSLIKTKPHFLPILNWETVSKIKNNIHELNLKKWISWQTVSLQEKEVISDNAFAIASRPSMYPRFPQGTIFIIDPDLTPNDGDLVLIKLKENNELTLRELIIDPPESKLHPIVNGSNIINYSNIDHQIVGVNFLTMLYPRKK